MIDVPSPCVSICQMEPDGAVCAGCLRTLDEIALWSMLDNAEKAQVWQELQQRRLLRDTPLRPPKPEPAA
jgi:uncharacterized protein